jgi:hypothetical protein
VYANAHLENPHSSGGGSNGARGRLAISVVSPSAAAIR